MKHSPVGLSAQSKVLLPLRNEYIVAPTDTKFDFRRHFRKLHRSPELRISIILILVTMDVINSSFQLMPTAYVLR